MIPIPEVYRTEYREAARTLRRCNEYIQASILTEASTKTELPPGLYLDAIRAYHLYLQLSQIPR